MRTPLLRLQSDERLASLAARGAEPAFEALVARHRAGLVRSCARILPESEAEDAVQQALLSAHQALQRNGAPERFSPWLHRIAVNAALKQLRRIPEELPLDEERTDGVEQPPQSQERRERLRETIAAVGALPARQQQALVLRELEGRSHEEIARTLGLTPGAVRQLIHRARSGVRSAVSAITPYGLLLRLAEGEGQFRLAELFGGGAAGALAGKTVVAAVVTGSLAGGIALAPEEKGGGAEAAAAGPGASVDSSAEAQGASGTALEDSEADDDSRRGPNRGSDGDENRSGHSGSSGSGGGGSGSSGSDDGDSSGSGSSGSGSSGSDSSGSGTLEGGSLLSGTSGSGTSGSGSSGSGTSGSGTSGSGTSGSGTSGSGDGDELN